MPDAYASEAQLADFLTEGAITAVAEADRARLLLRASEVLDDHVRASFDVDPDTFLPTDADVALAMQQACCAQIEFWLEVGEDHDVSGMAHKRVSVGHLSIDSLPPTLAPRARRILGAAGLASPAVATAATGLGASIAAEWAGSTVLWP